MRLLQRLDAQLQVNRFIFKAIHYVVTMIDGCFVSAVVSIYMYDIDVQHWCTRGSIVWRSTHSAYTSGVNIHYLYIYLVSSCKHLSVLLPNTHKWRLCQSGIMSISKWTGGDWFGLMIARWLVEQQDVFYSRWPPEFCQRRLTGLYINQHSCKLLIEPDSTNSTKIWTETKGAYFKH